MTDKWEIKKSKQDKDTFLLRHGTSLIFTLNWFQKVKIDKEGVRLYDRDRLSMYYSIELLPEHILNELEKLLKKENIYTEYKKD